MKTLDRADLTTPEHPGSAGSAPLPLLLVALRPGGAAGLAAYLPLDPRRVAVRSLTPEQAVGGTAVDGSVILVGVVHAPVDEEPDVTRLLRVRRETPIVVLSDVDSETATVNALAGGASGYVLTESTGEELLAALRRAARGQTVVDPGLGGRIASRLVRPRRQEPLVPDEWDLRPRERQVLEALVDGKSNREIAEALHLGEETIKTYLHAVYRKLGTRNRQQATALVLRRWGTGSPS